MKTTKNAIILYKIAYRTCHRQLLTDAWQQKSPATFVTGDQSLYLFFPRSQRMIFDIDLDGIANRYLVCQDQLRG